MVNHKCDGISKSQTATPQQSEGCAIISIEESIELKMKCLASYVPAQCFTLALYYIDKVTKSNQLFMIHSNIATRWVALLIWYFVIEESALIVYQPI